MKITRNPNTKLDEEEPIKKKINKTMHNTELADDLITNTNDNRLRKILKEKNERRKEAVNKMKKELHNE